MSYDYNKLRGRIVEKYGSQVAFTRDLKVSERTLSLKLNGKIYFSQDEISLMCRLLDIPDEEIPVYFFNEIVQLN